MMGLSFGAPYILAGLAVLPLIWWLLRYSPPRPRTELFPPLRLLLRIVRREETPDRSPWWLTLLRLAMAAAIIVALAEPVIDEPGNEQATGAIAIVMDNGWATAPDWPDRTRRAAGLIAAAGERGEPVVLAFTASAPNEDAGPFDAAEAARRLAAAHPVSAFVDRLAAAERVAAATGGASPGTLVLLTDGLATPGDRDAWARLVALGPERILLATDRLGPLVAIAAAENGADAYDATLIRPAGQPAAIVPVLAFDDKGRRIGETVAEFADGATEASAAFAAPFEIRNDYASIRVDGAGNAGATRLFDESQKRRRIGLLSAADADQDQPLLSPLHYIRGALSPFADLAEPVEADLSAALPALLERNPAMIVMADVGVLGEAEHDKLVAFVEKGGTLVRFAGPRLAAAPADDKLLPVRLRQGDRTLGGALSWTEPQRLAEFPGAGPFAGLSPPREVTVSRQVMAEPGPDLAGRTWANLEDGTPLVTGDRRGAGHVVLFHVTPEATWSNLPISGSFVDMLRRLVRMSRNQGAATASADGSASLPPWRAIAPDGTLAAPPPDAQPLLVGPAAAAVTLANPPGLYGGAEGVVALNLFSADARLDALAPPDAPVTPIALSVGEATRLKPPLLAGALALGVLDSLAALALGGALIARRSAQAAALVLAALVTVPAGRAQAQEVPAETAIEAISSTRLAYVLTGDPAIDSVSLAGLRGLTRFLIEKTALEPGEPAGVDLENDELAFFPIIYWPVSADTPMPSDKAVARLDAYMRQGGTVLFDTRDQLEESWQLDGAATPDTGRLRDILAGLNIPPLEPVPADHVLTKSFFLLETFPGLYADGALWVEAGTAGEERADRPVRAGDGVSPILITSNDLAAAWAEDENGEPLFPIASGDPDQREYALRAGVNIAMYMLTGNYKSDQVHVPALLERLGQ